MKKNSIIIAAVVVLSATLFSCTKEKEIIQQSPVPGTVPPPPPTSPAQVKIVSNWLTLLFVNSTYNSASSLRARHTLASPANYDYNTHVHLAFARRKGRESYVYDRLPMSLGTSQGNIQTAFTLNYTHFTINIWNSDFSDQRPTALDFEKMEYRYIVIPKSTYQALYINWDEYPEVAAALNLPISSNPIIQLP